jgi:hypothetical protein
VLSVCGFVHIAAVRQTFSDARSPAELQIPIHGFTTEFLNPILFNFQKNIAFWNVPRIRPVTATVDEVEHRALVEFE